MARRKPIFVRPLDLGVMATGNETAGHEAELLNRFKAIGLTWKSTGNTNLWVRGQFSAAREIDFMAVLAANALPGTLIRLRLGTSQAEVDGVAPYDSTALPFISPTPSVAPENGLYHSFLELPAAETGVTWWRIDITGHTGDFEAAMLVLGKRIEPSRFYNVEQEFGIEDLGRVDITRWAIFDEQPGVIFRTLDFALGWQTADEYENSFRPLAENMGQRQPLYCCFDPEATGFRQARTYFGVLRRPPFARGVRKPETFLQEFSFLSMI